MQADGEDGTVDYVGTGVCEVYNYAERFTTTQRGLQLRREDDTASGGDLP